MEAGKLPRREFLRIATLLGVSAPAAYLLAGCEKKTGAGPGKQTSATGTGAKKGGTLRVSMRVKEMTDPAKFNWTENSNAARQYLE